MNIAPHLNLIAIQAIEQPTADFGPLEPMVDKLGGLGWAISGFIGMMGLIAVVVIFAKNKWQGQSSQVPEWVAGIITAVMIGALAAPIVNWAMNG